MNTMKPEERLQYRCDVRESKKNRDLRVSKILTRLDEQYGTEYRIFLNYETDWQLLIAVMLSAQCTDARVNIVTAHLFQKYPTLEALSRADYAELCEDIRSIGFFNNKAKNILLCTKRLLQEFGGVVPSGIEELTSLAGVGRKTANVIRGNIYDIPSIVVDTHVLRISNKLGLVKSEDPVKVEYALMEVLPKNRWILWNINIITLGREICIARRPKCSECFLADLCPSCTMG